MARNVFGDSRIKRDQQIRHRRQLPVLRVGIRQSIGAFQLYADGKVIAAFASLITGDARMPRPLIERHILHDFAITANQTMRRNAQMSKLGKERMRVRIQGTSEQRINPRTTKFPRWQANVMHHQ